MTWVFPSLFKMANAIEVEAILFMKQQILQRIYNECHRQGLQPLSLGVINAVVQFFHQGAPVWNYSFHTLIMRLTLSIHITQF